MASTNTREKRENRAKDLINKLKSAAPRRIVFFSDEKTFVVDPAYNAQNDRWIRFLDKEEDQVGKYMPRTKHPAGAMFLGAVASTGEKSPPIWFPQGFRLGADGYIKALRTTLIPWMKRVAHAHGGRTPAKFVYMQDSAPAHTAKKTLAFLQQEKVDFWSPDIWPPNSPDLNPMEYSIWNLTNQGTGNERPSSVKALKRMVNHSWKNMDPEKIRAACRRFRSRLQRCVAEKGSYFD